MISTNVMIPEDCHLIINGEDFAGKQVWNNYTHLDGTGEFNYQEDFYKRNSDIDFSGAINIRKVNLDKDQAKQLRLAFARLREKYLKAQLEEIQNQISLIESGVWPLPIPPVYSWD